LLETISITNFKIGDFDKRESKDMYKGIRNNERNSRKERKIRTWSILFLSVGTFQSSFLISDFDQSLLVHIDRLRSSFISGSGGIGTRGGGGTT
jgi:hypothetical protein